jgi:hypothetical protein
MAAERFLKEFRDTARIVIHATEHQWRPAELGYEVKATLYALHPDGTPNAQVSLDADRCWPDHVDGNGTLTIQLLTPRSGVVCLERRPPRRMMW